MLFTRIYLGEKCKCAVFLKKKKEKKKKKFIYFSNSTQIVKLVY